MAVALTRECLAYWGTVCHLCGRPGATTADHLVPRHLHGSDAPGNLRPAHLRCNSRRQDSPLPPWRLAALAAAVTPEAYMRLVHVPDAPAYDATAWIS